MSVELPAYSYGGARTLVLLHSQRLTEFLGVWRRAHSAGVELPETTDPAYLSLDALLFHVLGAGGRYMIWMCECLGLDDPQISAPPPKERIGAEADAYLAHVLSRWRTPLAGVPEARFNSPQYKSTWGVHYCIDAMLEHAVMHPIRHSYQLEVLMNGEE